MGGERCVDESKCAGNAALAVAIAFATRMNRYQHFRSGNIV